MSGNGDVLLMKNAEKRMVLSAESSRVGQAGLHDRNEFTSGIRRLYNGLTRKMGS